MEPITKLKDMVTTVEDLSKAKDHQIPLEHTEELSNVESFSLDVKGIMEWIPHRYPMLLIDRLERIVLGREAVGIKSVTINEWFFPGHFPEEPVMPGVLIVEAMAQTAAVLVMKSLGKKALDHVVYFMSIEAARFRKPVYPGSTLFIHVIKQQRRGNVWKFKGIVYVNNQVVSEALYTAMIVKRGTKTS